MEIRRTNGARRMGWGLRSLYTDAAYRLDMRRSRNCLVEYRAGIHFSWREPDQAVLVSQNLLLSSP